MQMRQRDVAAPGCKIHEGVTDGKAENDALRAMMPLVVSPAAHQSSLSAAREATTPPAWIMQPPPDWQTPLNGIISP